VTLVLMLLMSLSACGRAPESSPQTGTATTPTDGQESSEPGMAPAGQTEPDENEPGEVDVTILDWEGTQALVRQQRGRVVVMDLWSTFCPPCIAEFPNLVALHREQGDRVACISVPVD